ncbi:hypothetical protein V6Z12_A06G098300 [Gossypium hirsutum]
MAILTASFCMSSFMSVLLMITFLGSAVSTEEGFNSSIFCYFTVRAPVVLLLAASVLILFFLFCFQILEPKEEKKKRERLSFHKIPVCNNGVFVLEENEKWKTGNDSVR